ncbi:MAG: phospholipase [Candidatus Cloacimonetes bacterium]|nr:phospholipase [Candidatus Cloacimonadota bacterium]
MKYKRFISLCILIILLNSCCYHIFKGMPEGTDYESEYYYVNENEIDFLQDLTYKTGEQIISEQEIFDAIFNHIDSANSYILIDMFLFNSHIGKEDETFRKIAKELSEKLINKKREADIQIDFITDPINTLYDGADSKELNNMEEAGINVIKTDLKKLPDSNIIYSLIWRTFFQWFGNSKKGGIFPHPFSSDEPKVTLRSYLSLLNFKVNHRKVFVADYDDSWVSVITSANPHDGSSAHSNIGILVYGDFAEEIYRSESAVAKFSKEKLISQIDTERTEIEKKIKLKLITEEKIKDSLISEIDATTNSDSIKMGMFYLSHRSIIKSLLKASERGVNVKIILDPNKDAFGRKKKGIPNRPVAYELVTKSKGKIKVRWYSTHGEQFHAKITFFESLEKENTVILGSANLTKRNIGNKNLELNVLLKASNNAAFIQEVHNYFDLIWNNEKYTVDYDVYATKSFWKRLIYRFTEFGGASTY